MIGRSLRHYRIVEKLGAGAMGEVYLADDEKLRRRVALKVLAPALAEDPEHLERFEREARAIAALNHPNIVTIHSVEEAGGVRFLTMEQVAGRTLDELIPEDGFQLRELLDLAVPLADALAAAHQRGVVHRDLKPGNVMVSGDGRLKVLDFGLAKLVEPAVADPAERGKRSPDSSQLPTEAATLEGRLLGTMPYMSPEQAQGLGVDHRCDIFSFGVVLYEMATGHRPFEEDNPAALIASILRDRPPPVTELNPGLPPALARLIDRCLVKEPRARPSSARDLHDELDQLRRAGTAEHEEHEASIAVLPFVDISPEQDQGYFCEGIGEELINVLTRVDGIRVASRTSSFQFKEAAADIRDIGRRLDVDTVLEGSVRKAGDRLRITAQLVDVADGFHLWSERFDRKLEDVFAIQDEIARAIASALRVTLRAPRSTTGQRRTPADIRAYEHYLRGRQLFYLWGKKNLERARECFTRAIEIDPDYALGYTGLADCCSFLNMHFGGGDPRLEEALAASDRALELAPVLAEAHASRGISLSLKQRYSEADHCFETATWIEPRLYEGYYFWARSCFVQGQLVKAARLFERASEVRPDDYQAPVLTIQVYESLKRPRKVREAARRGLALARRRLELDPDDVRAWYMGAGAHVHLGQVESGLEWAERALALDPEDPATYYNLACMYSKAGRRSRAVDCLERSVETGFSYAAQRLWIEHDSDLDPIRDHPRYQALVERLS